MVWARKSSWPLAPHDQPNPVAEGIRMFGTVWVVRQHDTGISIPAAKRYLYLQREQDSRGYSDQPHVRDQCDRPSLDIAPNPPSIQLGSTP